MRRRLLFLAVAATAAACAAPGGGEAGPSRPADDAGAGAGATPDPGTPTPLEEEDLLVAADSAEIVLPAGLRATGEAPVPGGAPHRLRIGRLVVECREGPARVTGGGAALTVVATGAVRLVRRAGARTVEEGPHGTVFLRDGQVLAR